MSKGPDAFRTISEVAEELDLPQHVLRFWETRFSQINPMKRGGGRRYYRPEDVELLGNIKALLYKEGYTIRGVQKLLKEQAADKRLADGPEPTRPELPEEETPETAVTGKMSPAVDVAEFSRQQSGKKGKSILNRLSGIVMSEDEHGAGVSIDAEDLKHLKSTLHELLECKRLLDQTRQD
jgi:DNA-binding transcriptional MerR regulator